MGGDGGSIPGRADIVRTAGYKFVRNLGGMGYTPNTQIRAASEKLAATEEKQLRWSTCALTQEPLRPPISACRLGQLFTRESLLLKFLHRKEVPLPSHLAHIRSRKDICDLKVELDAQRLLCPVLREPLGSGLRGVVIWSCGCVVSLKALEELKQEKRCSPPQLNDKNDAVLEGAGADPPPPSCYTNSPAALAGNEEAEEAPRTDDANNVRQELPNETAFSSCPVCGKRYDEADVVQLVPDLDDKFVEMKEALLKKSEQARVKRARIK